MNRTLLPLAFLALVTLGAASCSHVYSPSGTGGTGGASGTGGTGGTTTSTAACPVTATACLQPSDCPASTNPCVTALCEGGCCTSVAVAAGTPCPGGMCIGGGACSNGGCNSNTECPVGLNPCAIASCDFATGDCVVTLVPDGTPTPGVVQIQGDCQAEVCVGGMAVELDDDNNAPAIPAALAGCADAVCSAGVPSNPLHAVDSGCSTYMGNKPGFCSAAGSCVQCVTNADCTPLATCNGGLCM